VNHLIIVEIKTQAKSANSLSVVHKLKPECQVNCLGLQQRVLFKDEHECLLPPCVHYRTYNNCLFLFSLFSYEEKHKKSDSDDVVHVSSGTLITA